MNGEVIPLTNFAVEDSGDEDISCRMYYILLTDWPDGIHEVITEIIFEIDLDDGVKVNYGKFGDLLAEVKAITGKKPE